jgi:hypothetical protein
MRTHIRIHRVAILLLAFVVLTAGLPKSAWAGAKITILIGDDRKEGFNDRKPVKPVGGNTGKTIGEQRRIAFQYAATIWASKLDSNVEIFVLAFFDQLGPNVLGQAGAWDVFSDFKGTRPFPGAKYPHTWYGSTLADKLAGRDLDQTAPDILAQFSSDFDFYLGLDGKHGAQVDLVTVLLHELAHGFGFQNFVSETDGSNFGDPSNLDRYPFQTDVYSRFTLDTQTGRHWNEMTAAERKASAVRFGGVVWDGRTVNRSVPNVLSFGSPFVNVDSPNNIAGAYQFGTAAFGSPLPESALTAPLKLADDGVAPGSDGCTAFPMNFFAGQIALIDRGTCTFAVKAKNAQDAGALAVVIANNVAGAPPGLAGDDPSITIPVVSLSLTDATTIKGALGTGVIVSLGVDLTIRAGADDQGHARLYAVNPVAPGSSISHYDSIASPNLLMEPAINPDLTHSVEPPNDLTLPLLRDIGWFADADGDGVTDRSDICRTSNTSAAITMGTCDTGVPNRTFDNGCTTADPLDACLSIHGRKQQALCLAVTLQVLEATRVITGAQARAIQSCGARGTR